MHTKVLIFTLLIIAIIGSGIGVKEYNHNKSCAKLQTSVNSRIEKDFSIGNYIIDSFMANENEKLAAGCL